jgi:hypothetical protein
MSQNSDSFAEDELLRMIEADPLPLMDGITVIRRIVEMTEDPERCRSEVGEMVNGGTGRALRVPWLSPMAAKQSFRPSGQCVSPLGPKA